MDTEHETGSALSGPQELLGKLLEGRDAGRRTTPERFGNISDDSVRQLVLLCYYASQAGEEGRYPAFRVFISPSNNLPPGLNDPWQLLNFGQPVALNGVDDLKRLAPAASSHSYALEVREVTNEDGQKKLHCIGIRMAHSGEGGTRVLSSSIWGRLVRPGLMVRIDAPGEMRVGEAGRVFVLRAGRLTVLGTLPTLHYGWQANLIASLNPIEGKQDVMFHTLMSAWHDLLHSTSLRKRGGCFVILPAGGHTATSVHDQFGIRLKYETADICLGATIADFVRTCLQGESAEPGIQFHELANEWMRKRYYLLTQLECLSTLAGVDGCTVLDHQLRLLGFGGKIEKKEGRPNRPFKDFVSRNALDVAALQKTGTRHLSAFQLCNAADEITAYVISQDGHVTLFWSDAKVVWRWSEYLPWIKPSDHF